MVGPGTDLSRSAGVQGSSRSRWTTESPLVVVPGPPSTLAVGVDLELSPDCVGDATLERAEGFFAGLAFGLAAEVVRASGGVVSDLGDRDDVDRVVQRTVAARVQAVPLLGGAGCFDRCGAVVLANWARVRNRLMSWT